MTLCYRCYSYNTMDWQNQVPDFQMHGNLKHDRMTKLVFSLEQFYKHNTFSKIYEHFVELELSNISIVFYIT